MRPNPDYDAYMEKIDALIERAVESKSKDEHFDKIRKILEQAKRDDDIEEEEYDTLREEADKAITFAKQYKKKSRAEMKAEEKRLHGIWGSSFNPFFPTRENHSRNKTLLVSALTLAALTFFGREKK